ncbi:MAG: metallophosphoesterase family protein [Clostridia bacterium]
MRKIKIAILSDIHGNIVALESVIKELASQNIDYYLIAGDNITDFPFSNEVIAMVQNLTPYVIKGNREKYILEYLKNPKLDKWNTKQQEPIKFIGDNLNIRSIKYIKNLPESLTLNLEELKIKLLHGFPNDLSEEIYLNDTKKLDEISKNLKENILIFGHTHEPAGYKLINNKLLINAGTLGTRYGKKGAEYIVFTYENGKMNVEIKEVKYDLDKLKEKISETNILRVCPTWINLSYSTLNSEIDINFEFVKEAKKLMEDKTTILPNAQGVYKDFKVIDDEIWDYLSKKYSKYFLL